MMKSDNTDIIKDKNKPITIKEMLPYISLAYSVVEYAKRDIYKNRGRWCSDAEWFLNSEWGRYLQDSITEFDKLINNANRKQTIRLKS